jgi:hypothetical protein
MGNYCNNEKGHFGKGNPGRPKGAVNRLRTVIANPLRYDGRNPAEELHRIGFDEKVEQAERTRALAAAAPYYTPKAPQYIRNPIEIPEIKTVGDALATISQLTTLAGAKQVGLDEARSLIGNIESWVKAYQTNNLELLVARIQAELRGEPVPPLLAELPLLDDDMLH